LARKKIKSHAFPTKMRTDRLAILDYWFRIRLKLSYLDHFRIYFGGGMIRKTIRMISWFGHYFVPWFCQLFFLDEFINFNIPKDKAFYYTNLFINLLQNYNKQHLHLP
jgi:hypothetical protein